MGGMKRGLYPCADTAVALQDPLLAIREWTVRLHSHRHGSTMTTSIIRLRVLEFSRGFSAR
jgi:hypothetical protein